MKRADHLAAIALSLSGAAAYLALGWDTQTSYDAQARLAGQLAQGRWWLSDPPDHLFDLVRCGVLRYCLPLPPLTAIAAVPFLWLGTALGQSVMARVAGGAAAGAMYLALRELGAPRPLALGGTILSSLGTTLLFVSVDARTEYAPHAVAVLFASLALWVAARGGPPWAVGALAGAAALARLPVGLATPALALIAAERSRAGTARVALGMAAGALPFALAFVAYNELRWGVPWDAGPARLAEGNVFFSQGLVSLLYLPRQLYQMLLVPFDIATVAPYVRPRFEGMSVLLATPAYVWAFAALRGVGRDRLVRALAIGAGLALLPSLIGGSTGAPQLGYRAALDAQPFAVALAAAGDARSRGAWRTWPHVPFAAATLASAVIGVAATIGITRFGWWE